MSITIRIPHVVIAATLALLLHALFLALAAQTLIPTGPSDAPTSWRPNQSRNSMRPSAPLALIPWAEEDPTPPPKPIVETPPPVPTPPRPEPEIALGIEDGANNAPDSWVGFKEAAEHSARLSSVAQPQLDPDANNAPSTSAVAGGMSDAGGAGGSGGQGGESGAAGVPSPPTPPVQQPSDLPAPPARPASETLPKPNPNADPSLPAATPPLPPPPTSPPRGEETGSDSPDLKPIPETRPTDDKFAGPDLASIPAEPKRPEAPPDSRTPEVIAPRPRGQDESGPNQPSLTPTPPRPADTPFDQDSKANTEATKPLEKAFDDVLKLIEESSSTIPAPNQPLPPASPNTVAPQPSSPNNPGVPGNPGTPGAPGAPGPAGASVQRGSGAPGAGGSGGIGGEKSEKQVDASATEASIAVKPGRTIAAKGLEIITRRPVFAKVTRVITTPDNPEVEATFGRDGTVVRAKITKSSGYTEVDQPVLDAVYSWKARGEALRKVPPPSIPIATNTSESEDDEPPAPPGIVLKFTILLR